MKIKKLHNLRPAALMAVGVFLGHSAQADTTLGFGIPLPAGQMNLQPVIQSYGDNAAASSGGVTVTGFGTPNIGLTWGVIGGTGSRWDYYNDGGSVWSAGQLEGSFLGTAHKLTFTPNSASARVVVKSFNFHPYYLFSAFGERFTYNVSVLAGTNVVSGPTNITFQSDSTTNHPVNINYTGAPGQTLKLRIDRVVSMLDTNTMPPEQEGDPFDIAVDDIQFAQLPEALQTVGPQVVSVSPADDTTGLPAVASPPYLASITNGATTLVAGSIQLKLDGNLVSPPPTISSVGGMTNVSYPGASSLLASGSSHVYTLTYSDNVGSNYTSEVQFTVVNYVTLPAAYAISPGSGVVRGFTHRTVSASLEAGPAIPDTLENSVARAKAQLNGTLINTNTSMPYTNSAAIGPNADGSFNVDTVVNFSDETYSSGNFTNDVPFPGLATAPGITNQSFATESLLYLNLPPDYYRFGVNSDDGFEVSVNPPQGVSGSPLVVGVFDDGRGADDTLFDFVVQTSGIYCFKVIFFEGWGDANCEFFSVNLANSQKTLINDTNASAIISYRVLKPLITSIVRSGPNAVVDWAYGTPPFQVQFKTNLNDVAWNNIGSPTPNRTANVLIQPGAGFIRVFGQ